MAVPWIEQGLELARREGLTGWEAVGIYSLGVARWMLDDLEAAEEHVGRSVEILRGLDPSEPIPSPSNIAEIRTSRFAERPNLPLVFEDTLQPFAEISCAEAVGVCTREPGRDRPRVVATTPVPGRCWTRAQPASRSRPTSAGQAAVLVRRAYLALAEGDQPTARSHLEHALELRRRQSDRRGLGLALSGLGLVETLGGDHAAAERHLEEARGIFRRAGDRWGLASTLWRTADLAFARDDVDAAEAALEEALAVLWATGRERWIANTLVGLSDVALLRGDPARGRSCSGRRKSATRLVTTGSALRTSRRACRRCKAPAKPVQRDACDAAPSHQKED